MTGPQGLQAITIADLLNPLKAPMTKQYYVNDVDGDPTDIYHAVVTAQVGDLCLQQRFEYASVSGIKNVLKSSWASTTWQSGWDIV